MPLGSKEVTPFGSFAPIYSTFFFFLKKSFLKPTQGHWGSCSDHVVFIVPTDCSLFYHFIVACICQLLEHVQNSRQVQYFTLHTVNIDSGPVEEQLSVAMNMSFTPNYFYSSSKYLLAPRL